MATETLDQLPELNDPQISDRLDIMVLKKVYTDDIAYRADIGRLSAYYFPSSRINDLMLSLTELTSTVDAKMAEVQNADYMDGQNFVSKKQVEDFKKKILTEDRLNVILDSYMTYDELSSYIEDSQAHSNQIISEIMNYITIAGATSKSSNANSAIQQQVVDAIGQLNIPSEEETP